MTTVRIPGNFGQTFALPKVFGGVTFEEIQVGTELGPREWTISGADIDSRALDSGEYHEWYSVGSPFGGRIAPLSITYWVPRYIFSEKYPVSGLFVGWTHEQLDVLRTDRTMILQGRVTEKYVRRERQWVWYEFTCKDLESGNELFRTTRGHVLDYRRANASKEPAPEVLAKPADPYLPLEFDFNKDPVTRMPDAPIFTFNGRGRGLPIGTELAPVSFQFTRRAVTEFLGGRRGHYELEGLPAPVASGPHAAVQIHQIMVRHFGGGYVQHGRFNLRFVKMMLREDFVTAKGVVVGHRLENGADRVECDVWVERQTGEKVVVGSASALVPL